MLFLEQTLRALNIVAYHREKGCLFYEFQHWLCCYIKI
jgi:hypothetical protein